MQLPSGHNQLLHQENSTLNLPNDSIINRIICNQVDTSKNQRFR